ncbi:MAG: universal stress protein [Planctomycetes bacterium]|nr:universal stress protein [Planctomycetota bacterium]
MTAETRRPTHLVAALDADGLSDHAIHAALELRSILRASLEIVHAVRPIGALPDLRAAEGVDAEERRIAAARESALQHLEGLCARLTLSGPRPRIAELLRIEVGRPAACVAERARASGADLVLVGARHAKLGFGLGGTVRELLMSAPCSLWIQSTPVRPIRRILAPIDLSPASLHALSVAVSLARDFDASITLLHAFDASAFVGSGWPDGLAWAAMASIDGLRRAQENEFHATCRAFAWDGVAHTPVFLEKNPIRAILDLANEHDMIVFGTHGRGSALPSALGGTAWSVIRSAEVPVVAAKFEPAQAGRRAP